MNLAVPISESTSPRIADAIALNSTNIHAILATLATIAAGPVPPKLRAMSKPTQLTGSQPGEKAVTGPCSPPDVINTLGGHRTHPRDQASSSHRGLTTTTAPARSPRVRAHRHPRRRPRPRPGPGL